MPRNNLAEEGLEYDQETGSYRTNFETWNFESVSLTVVHAVTTIVEKDPLEMEEHLYDRVDPDSLDTLIPSFSRGTGSPSAGIWFTFAGFRIVIEADGSIELFPLSEKDRCGI